MLKYRNSRLIIGHRHSRLIRLFSEDVCLNRPLSEGDDPVLIIHRRFRGRPYILLLSRLKSARSGIPFLPPALLLQNLQANPVKSGND